MSQFRIPKDTCEHSRYNIDMVEVDVPELGGEQLRYNNDTWELTGTMDVMQNGELPQAEAKKPDRIRGSTGWLKFSLDTPPASLNPGNLSEFNCELTEGDDGYVLEITREQRADRYRLTKLRYD